MHGERIANGRNKLDKFGSSSHTRGTRLLAHQRRKVGRFIPAYAGNAWARPSPWTPSTVHPRMRGGRTPFLPYSSPSSGSSPHARGTLPIDGAVHPDKRFIPACAGNAKGLPRASCPRSVHPRMCGERVNGPNKLARIPGSSPHVRGTLSRLPEETDEGRFIPACAGNASSPQLMTQWPPVHPRMCGERVVPGGNHDMLSGSSPHVRGTLLKRQPRPHPVRFIPACAGNAAWVQCSPSGTSVHPRMCGERVELADTEPVKVGSSPHVRGTPLAANRQAGSIRFIPACAGNARWRHSLASRPSVHPRMRGERRPGTPYAHPPIRFIPACAGNALPISY